MFIKLLNEEEAEQRTVALLRFHFHGKIEASIGQEFINENILRLNYVRIPPFEHDFPVVSFTRGGQKIRKIWALRSNYNLQDPKQFEEEVSINHSQLVVMSGKQLRRESVAGNIPKILQRYAFSRF